MKIEKYEFPKSSFLSVEKDMSLIVDKLVRNENLQKLLLYPTKDCLRKAKPTEDEIASMFNKQVRMVPKLKVDGELMDYVIVTFDNFVPNVNNPEFRDNVLEFDIICHFDTWQLNDFQLRPYRIAAELDSMFDEKHLTGIGETEFLGATQIILTDEFAGLCLMYRVVHGEEDQRPAANPNNQSNLEDNFNEWRNTPPYNKGDFYSPNFKK